MSQSQVKNSVADSGAQRPFKRRRTLALWENTRLAFETLRDRSFRSLLTMLGVTIGVLIIIGVASVLNGFRQRAIDNFAQWGTNNIYVSRFPLISFSRPGSDLRKRKKFTLKDAWAIKAECPAVAAVSPEKSSGVQSVKYKGKEMMGPNVYGSFHTAIDVSNIKLYDGRFFTAEENQQRLGVCVIGWTVYQTLFPHETPILKLVSLGGRRFRVIGVMEQSKSTISGDEDPNDSNIFIPYNIFKEMFPWLDDHFIRIRARDGQLAEAKDQVEELLRRRRHLPWKDPSDFELNTLSSMTASFDKIVFATLAVMFALSTVAFMVGGVGVMNIMLASVKERTREIGLRRAIGARRRDITWQFLTEAMAITGAGGLLGVFCGEGLMRALIFFLPSLPCATPMWARVFGFFGSICVGLAFGLWPAISAARLDPIKALRYE